MPPYVGPDWELEIRKLEYAKIRTIPVWKRTRPGLPFGNGWKTFKAHVDGSFEPRGKQPIMELGMPEWNFRCAVIPINKSQYHWLAVIADFQLSTLYLFDPLGLREKYYEEYRHLLGIIGYRLNWRNKKRDTKKVWDWKYEFLEGEEQIQVDGHNCGIFVILVAWLVMKLGRCPSAAELSTLRHSREEFARIRHWVMLSIFNDRVWLPDTNK